MSIDIEAVIETHHSGEVAAPKLDADIAASLVALLRQGLEEKRAELAACDRAIEQLSAFVVS